MNFFSQQKNTKNAAQKRADDARKVKVLREFRNVGIGLSVSLGALALGGTVIGSAIMAGGNGVEGDYLDCMNELLVDYKGWTAYAATFVSIVGTGIAEHYKNKYS